MRAFKDDRGRAYNDIFPALALGDVNASILYPGTIKAFHRHQLQDDYWFVIRGHIRAVLVEEVVKKTIIPATPMVGNPGWYQIVTTPGEAPLTSNSASFIATITTTEPEVSVHYLSEGDTLHIPAGVWHGVQNIGAEEAIMLYHITTKYNEAHPDEERAKWNQWYDWTRSKK